jgi:predicted neuraminidase
MSAEHAATTWGVVFHDYNQLMAVTLKVAASGKISLHYMLNSYLPKVSLATATITLTCDKFGDIAGVRPDHNKHTFPTDISADFSKAETDGTLVITVGHMATHHCANLKASWHVAVSAARLPSMRLLQSG